VLAAGRQIAAGEDAVEPVARQVVDHLGRLVVLLEGEVLTTVLGGEPAETGRAEAQQFAESAPWNDYGDETVSQAQEYREAIFGIMNALRQVGFSGTDEQRARALEVLTETRRKLYAMLAEDES